MSWNVGIDFSGYWFVYAIRTLETKTNRISKERRAGWSAAESRQRI
jgi:hypothetical protein